MSDLEIPLDLTLSDNLLVLLLPLNEPLDDDLSADSLNQLWILELNEFWPKSLNHPFIIH